MAVVIHLNGVLADRKILSKDLAEEIGITGVNLLRKKMEEWSLFAFQL